MGEALQPSEVGIQGVLLFRPPPHEDARGSLTEVFRRAWVPGAADIVQVNLSRSRRRVLRGLHFHRTQSDYWVVLDGPAFVGLYDLREGSPTRGRKAELTLDPDREGPQGLYLPPGVAHGFYAIAEVRLLYLVDAYFTGRDEFGLAWDDPGVGLAWPTRRPLLSDRDRANPPLEEALSLAPAFDGAG
ncbi:MAG TPA: dTDP-4-dehydrorhamnose 3,5-epimerase family protein [Actinomycetota bacterium]|nr:dTDP-4-dehydrorhamnose 3,5-epimerase family protein [Actinomycetota bacterium]